MSVFNSRGRKVQEVINTDFSRPLRDPTAFALGHLHSLGVGSNISSIAFDPVQSLLAVGTERGRIFIFGGPAVVLTWDLGAPLKIKHLGFRVGAGFLVCLDERDTLTVFDLARLENDKPRVDSVITLKTPVTCLEISSVHSHLFIGGKDGTVEVYDLDRGCLATQSWIPNLWVGHEQILLRSGVEKVSSRETIYPICTDVKAHPLNVNLILIAYEGGVALWNLAKRKADKTWEFIIPPGAPGGGNSTESGLMTERTLGVTCVAWRPDGLMFAAGHDDGCISFAYCADELPITTRTLERADVHKVTEDDLFGWTAQGQIGARRSLNREPIFRLAWSSFPSDDGYFDKPTATSGYSPPSPRSPLSPQSVGSDASSHFSRAQAAASEPVNIEGKTVLTILGGLLPTDPKGIHLFNFPPFLSPTVSASFTKSGNISAALRLALKKSITPKQRNFYPTDSPPDDFLLLPRLTPHYSMAYDPTSIIITTSPDPTHIVPTSTHAARGISAWAFPPPASDPPVPQYLPGTLMWSGAGTCISADIVVVPAVAHRRLTHQYEVTSETAGRIPLFGGRANPQFRPRAGKFPETTCRIAITTHVDLSIHFWDISTELLGFGAEKTRLLDREFPRPLQHLTVDMRHILRQKQSIGLEAARLLGTRPRDLEITKVSLSKESLELAVLFSTGELVLLRFGYGSTRDEPEDSPFEHYRQEATSARPGTPANTSILSFQTTTRKKLFRSRGSAGISTSSDPMDQHIDLSSIRSLSPSQDGFRPLASLTLPSSSYSCVVMSDIGFLAASSDSTLLVVDMRGPDVLLFEYPGMETPKGKNKSRSDGTPITSITFAITAVGEDRDRTPRMIVVQSSGATRIFELSHVVGTWILTETVISFNHDSVAKSFSTFVLDKNGNEALANSANLQLSMAYQASGGKVPDEGKGSFTALWVTVSPSTAAAYFNIDGTRIATFDAPGGTERQFERAAIVTRLGSHVLMITSRDRSVTILSLPALILVTRMNFETAFPTTAPLNVSADGDFIQVLNPLNVRLHTAFDIGRPGIAIPELHRPDVRIPAQLKGVPTIGSSVAAVFGRERVYGASEMDKILGGTDRPPPKVRPPIGVSLRKAVGMKVAPVLTPPPSPKLVERRYDDEGVLPPPRQTFAALSMGGYTAENITAYGARVGAEMQESLERMSDDAAKFAADQKKALQKEAVSRGSKAAISAGFASVFK